MNEPPPLVLTPEEIAEANKLGAIGLLIFAGLVFAFSWQHKVERERERKEIQMQNNNQR